MENDEAMVDHLDAHPLTIGNMGPLIPGVSDVRVGGRSVVDIASIANLDMTAASENGAFGLRFYRGELQYWHPVRMIWITVPGSGTGPGVTAGDGLEIEEGVISMQRVFYDYLVEKTFKTPVLTLTMSGIGGAHEIGSPVTVTGFTHKETNIANIKPDTLKFYRGSTALETVTPSEQNATVTLAESITEPGTSTGSVTYKLQCTDTLNQPQSKSVTATWYRYVYSQIGDPEVVPATAASCVKQSDLNTFANNGATFHYTAGTCLWLLTTNENAVIETNVVGQWAPVTTYPAGSFTFTQANGAEATYYAYRNVEFDADGSAVYRITNS